MSTRDDETGKGCALCHGDGQVGRNGGDWIFDPCPNRVRAEIIDEMMSAAFGVRMHYQDEGMIQESIGASAVQGRLRELWYETGHAR